MRNFSGLEDIVRNGFCMSCGICVGCADDGIISMAWAENGHLRPRLKRPLTREEDAAVLRLCPGINQSGPFDGPMENKDDVWGELKRVVTAWSADPFVRQESSTGGVMTSVNHYLLDSGRAQFVLQVRGSSQIAHESEPVFIRDPKELLNKSASRYGSSSPLKAIRSALELGEPFAVSLKPCDIAGIRNLQREDSRAQDLIVFTQAMVCGTVPSIQDTFKLMQRNGADVANERPVDLRWRGNGCPGMFAARMPDGREVKATYNELFVDNPWTTQFRCKLCPDAVGMQADLVSADSWPNAFAAYESAGTNVVIARSTIGVEVLAECERLGYLETEAADAAILDYTQPHQTRLRRAFGSRLAGAIAAGAPIPNFTGLGEAATSDQLEPEDMAEVFMGTVERVRKGQADEPTTMDDWENLLQGSSS